MEPIFVEVVMFAEDMTKAGIESRDEVEDDLEAVLEESGLGLVTGGGSGRGQANIDVELNASTFESGLQFIRKALSKLKVPASTRLKVAAHGTDYPVYP